MFSIIYQQVKMCKNIPWLSHGKNYFTVYLSVSKIKLSRADTTYYFHLENFCLTLTQYFENPELDKYIATLRCQQLLFFFNCFTNDVRVITEDNVYFATKADIQSGGMFDQFTILLSGHVCSLQRNESVSGALVSPFSCVKRIFSEDYLSKEMCTSCQL